MLYDEDEECLHENCITENVCDTCGREFDKMGTDNSFSFGHIPPKVSVKSIIPELKAYNFPEDVKYRADDIYRQMEIKTKKGSKRKALIFYCVYNAYKELNVDCDKNLTSENVIDPGLIASEIKLKKNIVSKALNSFAACKGYEPINRIVKPTALIPSYAERCGLDANCVKDIVKFGEEICKKSDTLQEQYPQKVSAAIIYLYLEINGSDSHKKKLAVSIGISEVTINNTVKEIRRIYQMT